VVADRVLAADGHLVASLPAAPMVATAIRDLGLSVVVGPVISAPRVVHGATRSSLAGTGALAVDTETAYLLGGLPDGPAIVLRTIADTPERELRTPATIGGGWKALRALAGAAPALQQWAAALGERRILLAGPRSFCAGVERAITTVERALDRFGAPVYVRRQIVHNRHVVDDLEAKGAVFVEELDEVPTGATVVFSAHGVAPAVRHEAERRDLTVIDATCPLVAKVHHEVNRFAERGFQVVLIGHAGHDETEGTLGEVDRVTLVETRADVDDLKVDDPDRIAYITQTTLAPSDVADIVTELSSRYPNLVGPHAGDICYATQNRQDAVTAMASECDLILVVGSANSSNAARLVEVSERAGCPAHLIDDEDGLRLEWLTPARTVGVTAAASAPPHLVDRVVAAIGGLGPLRIESREVRKESVSFPLPLEVR
jgi:4-hydroxy-3-methylbut-2-enyl diphosphate reductase